MVPKPMKTGEKKEKWKKPKKIDDNQRKKQRKPKNNKRKNLWKLRKNIEKRKRIKNHEIEEKNKKNCEQQKKTEVIWRKWKTPRKKQIYNYW